jgi:hypothetical protein
MRWGDWPGFAGLRVALLWVIVVGAVTAWRYYWRVVQAAADGGAAGKMSLTGPVLLALGPPILFAAVHALLRRRAGRP